MTDRELLHAYFDGELSAEEAARFERALATDPTLAARLQELKGLDDALDVLPGHTATPAFTDRVLVRARRARRGRIVGLMAPLAAAAAVLLAVLLAPATEVSGPIDTEIVGYAWEADGETFGSLSLQDLEAEILEELDAT
ncbi:MAG: anti-sigma factor family protein [Planctomycetota bacterium]|jgi:anti-sigma factor RsiW